MLTPKDYPTNKEIEELSNTFASAPPQPRKPPESNNLQSETPDISTQLDNLAHFQSMMVLTRKIALFLYFIQNGRYKKYLV